MIKLENVTKTYSPDVTALQNANFDIAKGEFVFLVGPSGSGKSTMLRLMNRQERPEKGAVWVAGRNINDMPDAKVPHLRRNIGNIFQDYKLLANKTVFENVVNRPLILLADEPTGNLDPATGEGIMRLLDRINKTGTTVVMATHDQRIVNMMRKRVIQFERGIIVRDQARGVYE